MTTLLKTLGDDWHQPHPYVSLVHSVLPDATFQEARAIEDRLLQVYEDEHYDFKSLKQTKPFETTYEAEIQIAMTKKKQLEEEVKREEERFNKLLEKFKEYGAPETSSEEEEEEEEDDDDTEAAEAKRKGKGQKACRRTLKAEESRKRKLAQGAKTSMASSQVRLMELNEEIEKLAKLIQYYEHYTSATKHYLRAIREGTRRYSESKDISALIKEVHNTIVYYEKMMRRYVPEDPCCGSKGLCETHLLPLRVTVYPKEGFKHVYTCGASP